ncbi:S41 family peptidase [Pedobacter heparinus]|uniref:S41 family peptidase n=1 Tax=Pedobacter heparinus TaxID=984 RepID=UPI00292CAD05|nr:S41 family peptidase [Pedobacter heparinus]
MKIKLIFLSIFVAFGCNLPAQTINKPKKDSLLVVSKSELDKYLGVYSSTQTSLKITISKKNTTLMAQATGQNPFQLEAFARDGFVFHKADIKLLFNTSRSKMTLNQGGETFWFTKDNLTHDMVLEQQPIIYQPETMQADLAKFKNALIKTHPGLYTNQIHEEFENLMNSLMIETAKPLEATAFYKVVLKMIANVHDGHTSAQAFNELGSIIGNQKWLPFQILAKDERIFIVNNLSTLQIPEGSEILAIDDHLSNQILAEISSHFSFDGISSSPTLHSLGTSYFTLFGKIYPQLFREKLSYNLSYRDYKTKQILNVQVEPISKQNYLAVKAKRYPSSIPSTDAFNFEVNKQGDYAVLKIDRFFKDTFSEAENTFPDFYKKCFKEISANKIKNIIIDLRDNSGGKIGNASYLLQYFIDKSIVPAKEKTTLVNDESFFKATGSKVELDDRYNPVIQKDGTFKLTNSDALPELMTFNPIEENYFRGKLVVLINGGTVSAGAVAAGLFKQHTPAILVGSETGGYAGISNGVEKRSVRGDHTETAISIPLVHGIYSVNETIQKRGAIPDYQVSNSVQDMLENRDAVLEFVVKNLFQTEAN